MKKKALLLLICLALLGGGLVYGLPYGKIYQILTALQDRDGERLSRHVDFAALRVGLREQIRAAAPPDRTDPVDKVRQALQARAMEYAADQMVTPEGLIALVIRHVPALAGEGPGRPGTYAALRVFAGVLWQTRGVYASSSEFVVTFEGVPGRTLLFFLNRKGLDWRLSRIAWTESAGRAPN